MPGFASSDDDGGGGSSDDGACTTSVTTLVSAFLSPSSSSACKYVPLVLSAMQRTWSASFFDSASPTTSTLKSTPALASDVASAHGSASHVSSPSVMRITVALSSVYLSSSAAIFTDAESGVLPLGLSCAAAEAIASAVSAAGSTSVSMSLQSPLLRWP